MEICFSFCLTTLVLQKKQCPWQRHHRKLQSQQDWLFQCQGSAVVHVCLLVCFRHSYRWSITDLMNYTWDFPAMTSHDVKMMYSEWVTIAMTLDKATMLIRGDLVIRRVYHVCLYFYKLCNYNDNMLYTCFGVELHLVKMRTVWVVLCNELIWTANIKCNICISITKETEGPAHHRVHVATVTHDNNLILVVKVVWVVVKEEDN